MVSTINTDDNINDDIINQDIIKRKEEISKDLSGVDYEQNKDISQIKPNSNISDKNNYTQDLMINEIGDNSSKSLAIVSEFGEDVKEYFDTPCNL